MPFSSLQRATVPILVFSFLFFSSAARGESFKSQQLHYPKVQRAYAEKEAKLKRLFARKNVPYPPEKIYIRAFKRERVVEVWAEQNGRYAFLTDYKFCVLSGGLGPKIRQGDRQTPEGFYHINRFNPASQWHLSLGINYPNVSDRFRSPFQNLGGDIFIHGNCGSRGCIAITDDKIEELYLLAVEARNNGQEEIPVHIFPGRLDKKGLKRLAKEYRDRGDLLRFWGNLKAGFDHFESHKTLPPIYFAGDGLYFFQPES